MLFSPQAHLSGSSLRSNRQNWKSSPPQNSPEDLDLSTLFLLIEVKSCDRSSGYSIQGTWYFQSIMMEPTNPTQEIRVLLTTNRYTASLLRAYSFRAWVPTKLYLKYSLLDSFVCLLGGGCLDFGGLVVGGCFFKKTGIKKPHFIWHLEILESKLLYFNSLSVTAGQLYQMGCMLLAHSNSEINHSFCN